ncbi:MAG: DUF3782 domain-containing protein [Nitrospirae bacterium]|nr:DUF3782 domain-containing protein [Nitrospirota bacterium]
MYASEERVDRLECLIAEAVELHKGLVVRFEERDRQLSEQVCQYIEQAQRDRDAISKAFDRSDAQLVKTDEQLARREKETDKLDKLVKQTTDAVNKLTGKWSNFVEGLVLPATKKMFQERGFDVKNIFKSARSSVEGAEMEIDIMAVSDQHVVAIEIKSTLGIDDVNYHLEKLAIIKQAFTTYADRIVIGAVAGIVINEGVDKYAYSKGLFVIGQS